MPQLRIVEGNGRCDSLAARPGRGMELRMDRILILWRPRDGRKLATNDCKWRSSMAGLNHKTRQTVATDMEGQRCLRVDARLPRALRSALPGEWRPEMSRLSLLRLNAPWLR